ncbi:carboxyl transferase domain-containing protein [Actinophytocola sp.]|nr:carboxyl transferase domain-containing protein [Actinophytocola sp.]HYQ65841.1 carboxyl transferase domain-containing protein [Actinophytocola sp.]
MTEAPNILCGFGRLEGHAVGIVANRRRLATDD